MVSLNERGGRVEASCSFWMKTQGAEREGGNKLGVLWTEIEKVDKII